MTVTVFSKPACVQCDATYRALDKRGIAYRKVDITQDTAALELVRDLGYLQAPVVTGHDDGRLEVSEVPHQLQCSRVLGDVDLAVGDAALVESTVGGIALNTGRLAEDGDGHGLIQLPSR